ncbi:cupin domain-containing protein [Oceanobacillus massiliensis]|uniref:cupin domain-containing protein n=1 Tax=Oceanobacillus massiliensis TaxID=1465765 RepID=UPI000287B5BB|nr:cupin domain-containing protein [Oceanobacillus massiliensis]
MKNETKLNNDVVLDNFFSETWLERLLEATDNFSAYSLIHSTIKDPERITKMLKEAISNVESNPEKAIMRVFVEGGQNPQLLEELRNTKFDPNWDLDQWIQKTLGKNEYTTTFNGVSRWHDRLHSVITEEVVNPITKNVGELLSGIDTYAFMANSGYTPFGVHDDHDHSLIFHLGPKEKHVWIWPREEYLEMTGSDDRVFEIEDIKEYASHYALQPGDCLFIPKGDFHIFRNDGFSAFLGFILFPTNQESLLKEAMKSIAGKQPNELSYFVKEDDFERQVENTLGKLLDRSDDIYEQIKEAIKTNYFLLKGNGFSIHSPIILDIDKVTDLEERTFWKPKTFPIIYSKTRENRINIFLRGRTLNLNYKTEVVNLINSLNQSEYYSYSELISVFTTYLSSSNAKQLAQLFMKYRAIIPLEKNEG